MVYPTHGAGSLCSTGISSTPWSTIGYERRHDPLRRRWSRRVRARAALRPADVPALLRPDATDEPGGPAAARRVVPSSRCRGDGLERGARGGAVVVDPRSPERMPRPHPGSLSIPAGSSFGTWLGWVVDADRPVVLLVDDVEDLDDLSRQAHAHRLRGVAGYIDGGFEAWRRSGRPVEVGRAPVDALARELAAGGPEAPLVIDVRQAAEYEAGHVPGSIHIGAGDLPDRLDSCRATGDRDHLRQRLSLERRGVDAARGGFERVVAVPAASRLGGARLPGRVRTGRTAGACDRAALAGEGHAH